MITVPAEFRDGDPEGLANGEQKYCLAAMRSRDDGKIYTFAAYFLNNVELHYEEGCEECPEDENECAMAQGCGCPTTGWFNEVFDTDYDRSWERVRGTVIAHAEIPAYPDQ